MEKFLEIKNICHNYQDKEGELRAIESINLSAKEGEFISIVGPSGCGKSTLLSIVAGLITPSDGEIYIKGEKISGISNKVGYMLQKDNLLEWRSIYKNVILGLEVQKLLDEEHITYARHLLESYGLSEFADKYPTQMSGGMRQRAALIRTLAIKPEILLLDEAFSALDYQTRIAVTEDVHNILRKEKKTTLMVTHDIPESISMPDKVVVLTKRPAAIKSIHKLVFEEGANTPLKRREAPQFREYFNQIWRELDVHV